MLKYKLFIHRIEFVGKMKQQKISHTFTQGKTGTATTRSLSKKRTEFASKADKVYEATITFKFDDDEEGETRKPMPPRMGTRSNTRGATAERVESPAMKLTG